MSDTYLKSLVDKRQSAWSRAKDVMDAAAAEGRELTSDEQTELERIDGALDGYKAEETRLLKMKAVAESATAFRVEQATVVEEARKERREPTDAELLRSLFRGEIRSFESAPSVEYRALQAAEGGSARPTTFSDLVTVYERTLSPMFNPSVVSILNTPSGESITLPRLTADPSHGGTVTAEAGGINELDPTISSVNLDSYKYAIVTLWSAELGDDNVINLEDLVARSAGRELALDIGAHLTTGDGSAKPNGFITAGANGGTASGTVNNPFVGPQDLIDLFYGRAAPYRSSGVWQTSSIAKIRGMKDANGQFMWQPSLIVGAPDELLGRPLFENPAMAAFASASKSVAFGDFSRYFVRRTPLRVELSRDYKFSTDQVAIKVVERVDGDLVDTAAIAFLVSAVA